MSTDMLCAPLFRAEPVAADPLASAALTWATLTVLDEIVDHPAMRAHGQQAREQFSCELDGLGLRQSDLHEFLSSAVERGDWTALGLDDEPIGRRRPRE
jgi:hypothetical protein